MPSTQFAAAPRTAASRFSANARVPWLAGPHGDVLTALRSAVFDGAGALVLTGDAGTGKTIVARTLAELMRAQGMAIAHLEHPAQSPGDFLQAVGDAFGWPDIRVEPVRAIAERYFAEAQARGTRALLVIEDAHRLGRDVPAQIALLVKLARQQGADRRPPLTVLLVGHDSFLETLESAENAVLESLIDGRYRLRPLDADEARRYIERLVVAKSAPHVFTRPVIDRIAEASRGIPREIDALCEAALADSRPRVKPVAAESTPASAPAAKATGDAAPSAHSAVEAKARRPAPRPRKAYRNTVLASVGVVVLLALPAAYTVRHVRPQPAAARVPPSIAPPSEPAHDVVPIETPVEATRVETPPPEPPVQESVVTVPGASPTASASPPAPPPPTIAVAPPPIAAPPSRERQTVRPEPPALRPEPPVQRPEPPVQRPEIVRSEPPPLRSERPILRSDPPAVRSNPPTSAVPRPVSPSPAGRPLASERPARSTAEPAGNDRDPSALIDWLFRDATRGASD